MTPEAKKEAKEDVEWINVLMHDNLMTSLSEKSARLKANTLL